MIMKKLSLPFSVKKPLKDYLTRQNFEWLTLIFLISCAISVFTDRMGSQQTLTLDQGKIQYEGQVVASKMNGYGTLTFENGDSYEGQFLNGMFHGEGTYTSATGWVYSGQFKNGYADGKGKLTTEGQATYEGTFKQGIYQHAN